MQTLIWNTLNSAQKQAALSRPAQAVGEQITQAVNAIKSNVINNGDKALFELAEKFDKTTLESLVISKAQIEQASQRIATELKQAIQTAKGNIERFHQAQKTKRWIWKPKQVCVAKSLLALFKTSVYISPVALLRCFPRY